jgi:hypothetical protein
LGDCCGVHLLAVLAKDEVLRFANRPSIKFLCPPLLLHTTIDIFYLNGTTSGGFPDDVP